jgi:hypothetical protein
MVCRTFISVILGVFWGASENNPYWPAWGCSDGTSSYSFAEEIIPLFWRCVPVVPRER